MNKLLTWLENDFSPRMNKLNHNVWIVTLKDSVMQILPFILLGSVFCIFAAGEEVFKLQLPFSFWDLFGWTMGMVAVLVAFLIPFNFCEKKKNKKQRLIAGMSGLILYFIAISPELISSRVIGFGSNAFGAGGMFCSIIMGLICCIVFSFFAKFSFFKEDSPIPEFVRQWFDSMLPIALIVIVGFLTTQLGGVNIYKLITGLFLPLQGVLNTWYGFILINFLNCFIYSMGISAWVLTPVETPVKLAAITSNIALVAAGTATVENLNIFTEALVYTSYLWWGGIACTFPLVLLLAKSKSRKLKALGRACLGPSFFNINEPLVFGCIAWNPIMMIPMWIIGIVLPAIVWVGCKVIAFAPIISMQFDLWYTPFPISTWIASKGSVSAVILAVIVLLVAGLIWYPFFKVYEKQCVNEEEQQLDNSQVNSAK